MERIFASGRKPKRLQTDKGSEFTNAKVQAFLRKHNVKFFTADSEQKASIVERFNRTLKTRMFKYLTVPTPTDTWTCFRGLSTVTMQLTTVRSK